MWRSTRAPGQPHVRVAGALGATRTTLAQVLMWPWLGAESTDAPGRPDKPRLRHRSGKRPEHAEDLDMGAQAGQGVGHVRLRVAPLEVEEEHVAPESLLARTRLDPGQVHLSRRELRRPAPEPAGGLRADAPEPHGGLPRADRRLGRARSAGRRADRSEPYEPGLVARHVLDAGPQHPASIALGGQAGTESRPSALAL